MVFVHDSSNRGRRRGHDAVAASLSFLFLSVLLRLDWHLHDQCGTMNPFDGSGHGRDGHVVLIVGRVHCSVSQFFLMLLTKETMASFMSLPSALAALA